jgi:hypothetical protein
MDYNPQTPFSVFAAWEAKNAKPWGWFMLEVYILEFGASGS